MTKRMIIPLLFGLIGCGILLSLGIWQVQRLAWKEAILAEIQSKIDAKFDLLPEVPNEADHKYKPVVAPGGTFTGEEIHVLFSLKQIGPGYRVIAKFITGDGRAIMVDRGHIPTNRKDDARGAENIAVAGNLHWPQEVDSFTPAPDTKRNIWFARLVPAMAAALGTEEVLLVAKTESGEGPDYLRHVPVTPTGIPNDHLQYAITWFLLCAAWAGMTAYLLWRIRQRTV
ncbi:MAG: SURF1 family protein [Pseudomonadota bacterium]